MGSHGSGDAWLGGASQYDVKEKQEKGFMAVANELKCMEENENKLDEMT